MTTTDNSLIKKTSYEALIGQQAIVEKHPIEILGEAFYREQMSENGELALIRYAQAELYFHLKDYEAAIYKWEKVNGELDQWAKKNIGDCYIQLGLLANAEEIYKSISSHSLTLKTEAALQLLSLYIEQNKFDMAFTIIKEIVAENPDYPNVTTIARAFFEDRKDWSNAIELAAGEAIRTESTQWFITLKTYIDKGLTTELAPNYFHKALITLFNIDDDLFEQTVISLWKSYQNEGYYLAWMTVINSVCLTIDLNAKDTWNELPLYYYEAYQELTDGMYYLSEIADIIPNLLQILTNVGCRVEKLFASSALLAWSELFPTSIAPSNVAEAERLIVSSGMVKNSLEDSQKLLHSILSWATKNELTIDYKLSWISRELADLNKKHLLISGVSGKGKATFINDVLLERIAIENTSNVIMYKAGEAKEIHFITEAETSLVANISDFHSISAKEEKLLIECILPSPILADYELAIVDIPCMKDSDNMTEEMLNYLPIADCMLFVVDGNQPFANRELAIVEEIQEHTPNLPIIFLLNKQAELFSNETKKQVADTIIQINKYFPEAKVLPYSSEYNNNQKIINTLEDIQSVISERDLEDLRHSKLLLFIRKMIMHLLEKQIEVENMLIRSSKRNEEIVAKLSGAINQLADAEHEQAKHIKQAFREIKEEYKRNMKECIPKILRECTDLIKEDSDFRQIHFQLNKEMNARMKQHIVDVFIPALYQALQGWIALSNIELQKCHTNITEMTASFNALLKEERIKFVCDFKIIEDWRRDVDRMTNRVQIDEVNIMLRHSPMQLMLKSAGKLFHSLPQNKSILYNQYKKYVENENFEAVATIICDRLFLPFEMFENAVENDVSMFFKNPFSVLKEVKEEAQREIEQTIHSIMQVQSRPEVFQDPLTLFEVRLRQIELLNTVKQKNKPYPYRVIQ